jgi:hypothetical protein
VVTEAVEASEGTSAGPAGRRPCQPGAARITCCWSPTAAALFDSEKRGSQRDVSAGSWTGRGPNPGCQNSDIRELDSTETGE